MEMGEIAAFAAFALACAGANAAALERVPPPPGTPFASALKVNRVSVLRRMGRISLLLMLAGWCAGLQGAALEAIPRTPVPPLPAGLEKNQGQAKLDILFLARGGASIAVTAQSIHYSPLGLQQIFVGANPGAAVRFSDPLPGMANVFTGNDPQKWVTGIPRYATALLTGVYPGIDARYSMSTEGVLTLTLVLHPGADLSAVVFDFPQAATLQVDNDHNLRVQYGSRYDPSLTLAPPVAWEQTPGGPIRYDVSFELQSKTRTGLAVTRPADGLTLEIDWPLNQAGDTAVIHPTPLPFQVAEAGGATFVAGTIPDAAGKDPPFAPAAWEGCGKEISLVFACADVVVYKYAAGEPAFVSYLSGRTREALSFFQIAPDGALVVAGATDSPDFPATAGAFQSVYGGPPVPAQEPAVLAGDYFAADLDPMTGVLRAATFLGGPAGDTIGETAMGPDGSLYFMPGNGARPLDGMPVTPGALLSGCTGIPCAAGYAAHLDAGLARLLYGTYLPGSPVVAERHTDGSVYYAGAAGPDFPATPGAFQTENAGDSDGFVARLDPSGSRLLFATYIGGPTSDVVSRMAVAPDGAVWFDLNSNVGSVDVPHSLVELDAAGATMLARIPVASSDLAVDHAGNLHAVVFGPAPVTEDAFQSHGCPSADLAYLKVSPAGDLLFGTYLPNFISNDFDGANSLGEPYLDGGQQTRYFISLTEPGGVLAGCLVDGASFANPGVVSPGAIVTLFGSRMGPKEGVAFALENGRVPALLGGTRVLVDSEEAPILYASYGQLNIVLPYDLPAGGRPTIQVEHDGVLSNELSGFYVDVAGISLFGLDASATPPAAALNQDGTVNSPDNPAKRGSRVVLFGTGGGETVPASIAGEVTPLAPRPLANRVIVEIADGLRLTVEYAGAAPGLVAGVTQINVKIPEDAPTGVVRLRVDSIGLVSFSPGDVTIAVGD